MSYRFCFLVTSLACIALGDLPAEDLAGAPVVDQGSPGITSGGSGQELQPGSHMGVNSPRQVVIRGQIDIDALIQDNYTDANNNHSDHRGYGLLRAELGTKVTLDERVAAIITIGYYNELGSSATPGVVSTTFPQNLNPTQRRGTGQAVINDAYIELKDFLSFQELGVDAGRMPFIWNLRQDKGAFLYDSRANDPAVTSWDGARATYNLDSINITPYSFRLPDNSTLYGGAIDWQPPRSGSNRTFITGSVNLERNVQLRPVASDPTGGTGSRLITYYAGAEFELNDFDIYGEYATQRGSQTNNIKFDGWGADAGMDWRSHLGGGNQFVLGIKGDYLSGDNNPTDNRNDAFINNWSGTADTYIVESPKYGQIAHYLQGDLEDLKLTAGISFDEHNRIRLSATYGYFREPKPAAGSSSAFGQEGDLTLTWQYTYYSTFRLFAGAFKPLSGFDSVAPAGPAASGKDPIYLLGLNLNTTF